MKPTKVVAHVCLSMVLLFIASQAHAQFVANSSDSFGNSSFISTAPNDGGYVPMWTNDGGSTLQYPDETAGGTYITNDFRMRTPDDGGSYTFDGQLILNNTNGLDGGLMYKGASNTGTLSVADLVLNGGTISHQNGTGDIFQLAGGITVQSDSTIHSKQGPIQISSSISGTGNLSLPQADSTGGVGRAVSLLGDASGYSGNIDVAGYLTLGTTGTLAFDIGSNGTNNAISGTGTAVYDGVFTFDLSSASSNPGDMWTISSVATQSYGENFSVGGGFSQSGSFWSNGTYLFDPATSILAVATPPVEWITDLDNQSFTVGSNWAGGSAPSTGEDALFGTVITGNRTVLLDDDLSLNSITFSNTGDGDYYLAPQTSSPGTEEVLTLTGEGRLTTSAGRHWVQVDVQGGDIQKTGTGELILDHANSFTGNLTIANGRLSATHPGAIPSGADVILTAAGSNLLFGGDNGFFVDNGSTGGGYVGGTVDGVISGDGTVIVTLGATTTFTGANTFGGALTVEGSGTVLTLSGSGTPGLSNGTAASETRIAGTAQIALASKSVGDEVLKLNERADAGTPAHLTSSGTSSWAGNIYADTPEEGSHYKIATTSGTLTLSGTLSAFDAAAPNDRFFVFDTASGSTIQVTGKITDFATDANGDPLDVDMNNVPDTNLGDNVNVIKRGAGSLNIATATNNRFDYWRATTVVEEGTLNVISDGSNNGEISSSSITVQNGGTFNTTSFGTYNLLPIADIQQSLGGGGVVQANTLGVFEGNSLNPGDGVGTLTINGNVNMTYFDADETVAVNTGSLNFELGSSPAASNDLIDLNGALTINSTNIGGNQWQVNVTPTEGTLSGTYTLIDANSLSLTSTTSSSFGVQIVDAEGNALASRYVPQVGLNTTSGNVTLSFTGSALNLTWNGTGGTNEWNTATSTNWQNGGSPSDFQALDKVTFSSGGVKDVVLNSNVLPGSVTFNSNSTYNFTGAGGINGSGPVNVNQGTVQLHNTANNYTGTTTVATGATLEMVSASTGGMSINGTLSLGKATQVTVIDDFSGNLSSYTNTVILDTDTGGGPNTAAWQITGGTLEYNTSTYQSIEQSAMIRSGLSLAVGEELQVDLTHSTASQDIGLYVGGTAPTAGVRQDYVAVYGRGNGEVLSRGFDGTNEFGLVGGGIQNYSSLFIARTAENTFELGYYDASGRNIVTTRTPATANTADVVGFYTDVRAAGVLGNLDNLRVVELGGTATLDVNGDFDLGSSGTLELDITAMGFDSLDISGIATLSGEIAVNLESGLTPDNGAQFTILSAAGGIATALGSLDFGAGLPTGFTASYNEGMTDLILTFAAGLGGDFNGDGTVNLADYTVWRNNLGADESVLPVGTGDGSTLVDVGDYNLWKTNFGMSTAAALNNVATVSANVPEPSSFVLLAGVIAGGAFALRRRGIGQHSTV